MKTDTLLRQTRIHFPRLDAESVRITPIEKGGSDRRFYRVHNAADQNLILVKYDLEREENRQYVAIAKFLDGHGIRVPKIYFHDPEEGLIWIEDLGEEDLFSHREESWLVRRALYESALDEAAKLHQLPQAEADRIQNQLPAEFNAALYLWEQKYFLENCLGRFFHIAPERLLELAALPALQEIAQRLDRLPRNLVHRDFQSQNIIVQDGQAYLIDFQGMRPGLAQYDLASLLFDPYVELSEAERDELTEYYLARRGPSAETTEEGFKTVLTLCAMQRLMQALGAYGFLGLVKGHGAFLRHIPTAIYSLEAIVSGLPGLEELRRTLDTAIASGRVPASSSES
jgi:N-acetylmuramate 1-kinase